MMMPALIKENKRMTIYILNRKIFCFWKYIVYINNNDILFEWGVEFHNYIKLLKGKGRGFLATFVVNNITITGHRVASKLAYSWSG